MVVPTLGRRESLLRVLSALAQQLPSGAFEVVVVCDGDTDGSADACRGMAATMPYPLQIVEQSTQGPASARNRGIAAASGDLIVFLDDDVLPDPTLVATHIAAHAGQMHMASIGPLLPPADVSLSVWGSWEERMLCRQYDDMVAGRWEATHRQFYTGNAAVRKDHILAAGGFDPSFKRAEDVELALRLSERGTKFVFLPQARGWHYVQRPFQAWVRVPAAYGAADVSMARSGRPEILGTAVWQFKSRRLPVRLLTHVCVGRGITNMVVRMLGTMIRLADRWRLRSVSDPLCSLIFNLEYYHGLAGALGGRNLFVRLMSNKLSPTAICLEPSPQHTR
ncbi:MAG: glycosyl transferase family 2 [Chloroflexi bacterium]|nr:glycosyl transferase family 2 [Chloroflexota bacterium]